LRGDSCRERRLAWGEAEITRDLAELDRRSLAAGATALGSIDTTLVDDERFVVMNVTK